MPKLGALTILAALLLVPASAGARVPSLPPVERTLTAAAAEKRDCASGLAEGARGIATTSYTAPISGFVDVRLAGARGDWDLALYDARTKRLAGTSQSFGAREVAQTWIGAGERLVVQGCRRSGDGRDARVSVELLDIEPPKASGAPMLVRVAYDSQEDLARLERAGVDVTHHIHDGRADAIVSGADQLEQLRDAGYDADVEIANLADHYAGARRADAAFARRVGSRSSLPSQRTTYRVYADYQRELKALAEEHPTLVKPIVLPKRSFQGREVQGVEIGRRVRDPEDGRPVFLLVALHHAREWPSAEAAMEFAHMLVRGDGTDPRITGLLDRSRVIVVPLVNPDGFISSRGAVDPVDLVTNQGAGNGTGQGFNPNLANLDDSQAHDPYDCPPVISSEESCDARVSLISSISPPGGLLAYRRKNCNGLVPDGRVPCELQWGVDPNRNYGYNWGGPGSSGEWMSQAYRGTGPWSEPETQNVHELSQRRQVTNIITLHNVAALVLRPPGTSGEGRAPDEEALKQLGDAMADATGYESQYGFQLYDTSGTTEDWNYAQQGAFGYTVEIGPKDGEFHMPYETGVVKEWDGTTAGNGKGLREAMLLAWEAAANPQHHSVIEGIAPRNRTLRAKKTFTTVTQPTCRTDHGIEPLNSEFLWGLEELALGSKPCADPAGPITVPDGLDTTMRVPASGAFEWHVNPSTRPFLTRPISGVRPLLSESQVTGSGEPLQPPPTAGEHEMSDTEHEIVIAPGQEPSQLRVELGWETPVEDYDLYLFRDEGGTLVPVGSGRGPDVGESATGARPEYIAVDEPSAGRYVVRVTNWAAASNEWTLKVQKYGPAEELPPQREAWTVTCEDAAGRVLARREVTVDRGGRAQVDFTQDCRPPRPAASVHSRRPPRR
jgi:hypothetical protein